jgi:signal transduction histidine kinase
MERRQAFFLRWMSQSLSTRILLTVGVLAAAVILVSTILAYGFVVQTVERQSLQSLKSAVTERSLYESNQFVEAQENTVKLRDEFVKRIAALGSSDPQAQFDSWFARSPDGLVRLRPELDDHVHLPSIYIRPMIPLTPDLRRQVMAAFNMLREWGPPLTFRYYSAYIDLPGISLVMFSPSVNWGREAGPTTNNFDYPPVRNSAPDRNPARKTLWTEVYYDDKAGIWMVSTITPIDYQGKWIATASQDISVEYLKQRTVNQDLPGSYNLIISGDGKLVAHPSMDDLIKRSGGNLDLKAASQPGLLAIYQRIKGVQDEPTIMQTVDQKSYLIVTRIRGPHWYFVTVYPRALLEDEAYRAAQYTLLSGAAALLIQVLLIAWVLQRDLSRPLARLKQAVGEIAAGKPTPALPMQRNDELGLLASAIKDMAQKIDSSRDKLERAKSELVARNIALDHANRVKTDFLANMSHELRTPLNAILGFSEMMQMETYGALGDSHYAEYVRDIRKSAAHLMDLIRDILDLARIESGKAPLELADNNLQDLIGECLDLVRPNAVARQVTLTYLGSLSAAPLRCDRRAFKQMLLNLLSNAIKHTPAGGSVTVTSEFDGQGGLAVGVADTGPGIDSRLLPDLFTPFSNRHSGIARGDNDGHGLGLSITRGLIELHGGRIEVDCQPSQGTRMTLLFPAALPDRRHEPPVA